MTATPIIGRSRQEAAEMQCPSCRTIFNTPVWLVIDAGERPDLQAAIRDGTLATFACPNCSMQGTITSPLLYHDGAKQQLYLAVPLSMDSPEAVQELAEEFHAWLLESIQAAPLPQYLQQIELVAELDGLEIVISDNEQALVDAIQAILNVETEADFQRVFVQHRAVLMSSAADRVLAQIGDQALANEDQELGRRVKTQRATLGRFRATLQSRRSAMSALINKLPAREQAQDNLIATVKAILHAADPQEVYAARLQHHTAEQSQIDALLEQLHQLAQTEQRDDLVVYFEALESLRTQ